LPKKKRQQIEQPAAQSRMRQAAPWVWKQEKEEDA
jgi:hypothetical protein